MRDISAGHLFRMRLVPNLPPIAAIVDSTLESLSRRYGTMQIVGDQLADLIPEGGTVLTQCFGETIIGTLIQAAAKKNKSFRVA